MMLSSTLTLAIVVFVPALVLLSVAFYPPHARARKAEAGRLARGL
jgi:hypothetical protein